MKRKTKAPLKNAKISVKKQAAILDAVVSMEDLFGKKEKLAKELKDSLITKSGMTFVKHPLIVGIYSSFMNAQMNYSLRKKTEAVKICLEQKDFSGYIFWHERPFRLDALMRLVSAHDIEEHMGKEKLAKLIMEVYTDSEYPGINRDIFLFLFRRFFAGTKVKAEAGASVPKTLFRGTSGDELKRSQLGLSWTESWEAAEFFSHRNAAFNHKKPRIYIAENIPAHAVFATYDGRNEQEFICDPRTMRTLLVQT